MKFLFNEDARLEILIVVVVCHVTTPSQTIYVLHSVTSADCVLSANFSQTETQTPRRKGRKKTVILFVSLDLIHLSISDQ